MIDFQNFRFPKEDDLPEDVVEARAFALIDNEHRTRAILRMANGSPVLALHGDAGSIALGTTDKDQFIILTDKEGVPRVSLSFTPAGSDDDAAAEDKALLMFNDESGRRVLVGFNGLPAIQLRNADGSWRRIYANPSHDTDSPTSIV